MFKQYKISIYQNIKFEILKGVLTPILNGILKEKNRIRSSHRFGSSFQQVNL
ncbi:hypothetical protein Hanom_Chr15g01345591 [Helianthus anomalus]